MCKQARNLKVALAGSYPPPYGGVSIHIQRLCEQIRNSNISCTVFDTTLQIKKIKYVKNLCQARHWLYVLFSKQDIIHVHTTSMHWQIPVAFLLLSILKGARFVLSYHSLRYSAGDFSWLGRKVMKLILTSASHCIADSPEIKEGLVSMGGKPDRISIIPAFIPPTLCQQDIDTIPDEVWCFIDSHEPVISAGASRLNFYNGQDIYGLDMCIALCGDLKFTYPEIGFVFCLPQIGDYKYLSQMRREIKHRGIVNNFLLITYPLEKVYPIWQKSDIFVRPTISDGDAVSLREALYLKTPSLASDVAPRPEGAVLFKNRDAEDFVAHVKMVWDNYSYYKSQSESIKVVNGLSEILKVYDSLSNALKGGEN